MKIGEKIGKVIKIDRNTESKDRGQYVRFCIEVDLTKPLLSRFRLNGRVWGIQYEGLKQICFKCGHLGHKEDGCPRFGRPVEGVLENLNAHMDKPRSASSSNPNVHRPDGNAKCGAWMLVQKPTRRYIPKAKVDLPKGHNTMEKGKSKVSGVEARGAGVSNQGTRQGGSEQLVGASGAGGSRFNILDPIQENDLDEPILERNLTAPNVAGKMDIPIPSAEKTVDLGEDDTRMDITLDKFGK